MAAVTLGGNPVNIAGNLPFAMSRFCGNQVLHSRLAPEIKDEPDYAAALAAL